MPEGIAVIALTTVLLVVLAVAVVVGVAVSRRPASSWQACLREQAARLQERGDAAPEEDPVAPVGTSLADLLSADEHDGSAYIDPEGLPGYGRLEQVAQKVEDLQAARRP